MENKRVLEGFMLGAHSQQVGAIWLQFGGDIWLGQPEVSQCTLSSPLPAQQPLSNTGEVMALSRAGRLRPDTGCLSGG